MKKLMVLLIVVLSAQILLVKKGMALAPSENSLFIEFKKAPLRTQIEAIRKISGVAQVERFDSFKSEYFERFYRLQIRNSVQASTLKEKLLQLSNVKRVDQSFSLDSFSVVPTTDAHLPYNDPLLSYQWAIARRDQKIMREIDDINSRPASSSSTYPADVNLPANQEVDQLMKKQVLVAVLDSGVDLKHPDLMNNIYKNEIECDKGEIPFDVKTDKDNNGYPGDCMGWNFTTADANGNNNPDDDLGHGTHVAGIIAAEKSNGQGVSGLSNRIRILPIKVTSKSDNGGTYHGLTLSDRMTKAILYAIKMKADVINLSLGWPKSLDAEYLRQAFAEAQKAGISIVAAAGNNNHTSPVFPCSYAGVICVGAVGIDGTIAPFSNYGGHIDLNAPGEEILSLYSRNLDSLSFSVKGFEILNGTSQAAPFVTGAVAILKGIIPNISENEVKARLFLSSSEVAPNSKFTQFGMLKIDQAIKLNSQPALAPDFKSLDRLIYQIPSQKIQFDLPIKNYWAAADRVQITIQSLSPQFRIDSQSKFEIALAKDGQQNLKIDGTLLKLSQSGEIHISVEISSPLVKTRVFHHIFQVSRSLKTDRDLKRFAIHLTKAKEQLPLLTVRDFDLTAHAPEYYWSEKSDDGLHLHFISFKNGVYEEQPALVYPKMTSLLWVMKGPLFENQKRGYMLSGISLAEDKKTKYIAYFYLNSDLKATEQAPEIQFTPETVVIDNAAYAKLNLVSGELPNSNGAGRALPVFIGGGKIPKADLNPDPFEFEPNRSQKRVFFLEPKLEAQKWTFATRNYDNYLFRKHLREELKLAYKIDLNLVAIFPQSSGDLAQGSIRILFSYGQSDLKNYVVISANSHQLLKHEYNLLKSGFQSSQFDNNPINQVIDLSSGDSIYNSSAMFSSFVTPTKAQLNFLSESGAQLENRALISSTTPQDYLLGFLQAFKKGNVFYSFLQSKSNLILQTSSASGVIQRTEESIKRSSLLPGSVFDELFFPVSYRNQGSLQPALYVDATQVSSQSVYLWVATEQGLVAPANMNIDVPTDCRALAPQKFSEQGDFAFVFLCKEKDGWEIQSLLMN